MRVSADPAVRPHYSPQIVIFFDTIAVTMRWAAVVALAGIAVLLSAAGAFADGGTQVWLQPGDQPGTSPTGELRLGCAPITVWAQGDAAGEGVWSATPLAVPAGSDAHTLIGLWSYAGGAAAAVADLGAPAAGRYHLRLFGALARERIVTVDCARPPAAPYAPVLNAAPPPATGGAAPVTADGAPPVQLVALRSDRPPPASPVVLGLLGGLLVSLFLIGWSFARR